MSKQAKMAFTDAILTAGEISAGQPFGKLGREISAKYSAHVVYVNRNELEHELADLIYRSLGFDASAEKGVAQYNYDAAAAVDPTVENYVFKNEELKTLTDIVYNNLYKAFVQLNQQYKDSITIEGSSAAPEFKVHLFTNKNNYDLIGKAFSQAWEGRGQYGGLKDFIINTLGNKSTMGSAIADATEHGKSGFDRGHGESAMNDVANIEHLINVVGLNSIKNMKWNPPLTLKQYKLIEQDLKATFGNPQTIEQMWGALRRAGVIDTSLSNFEDLMETYVEITLSLTKQVAEGKVALKGNAEAKITSKADLEDLLKRLEIAIRPQSALANQAAGGMVQRRLGALFEKRNLQVFQKLDSWLKGQPLKFKRSKHFKMPPPPFQLESSDSLEKMAGDSIYEGLTKGKISNKKTSNAIKVASKPVNVKVKETYSVSAAGGFVKQQPVAAAKIIRKKRTQQLNIVNIVNLINMQLADTIRQNMGTPKLNYRSGRFASSARALPGSLDRDGYLRLPYTYMKYPYQTFEVGYAQGNPQRDPRKVISESIRELAARLVLMKMRVVRI